jgi:formylglycine-generating enzyme required for sulfatase activity
MSETRHLMLPPSAIICFESHMSGNVWEWCLNKYDTLENIGTGGAAGRVVRGGSWYFDDLGARAAFRFWFLPHSRYDDFGFRVVLLPSC